MAVIKVPRPPKSAFNKNRPLSTLLGWQIYHAQEAELALPVQHSTDVYVNAIKTEGEAADYIRKITEKVHELHDAAAQKTAKTKAAGRRGLTLAAAAKPTGKKKSARAPKSKSRKTRKPRS